MKIFFSRALIALAWFLHFRSVASTVEVDWSDVADASELDAVISVDPGEFLVIGVDSGVLGFSPKLWGITVQAGCKVSQGQPPETLGFKKKILQHETQKVAYLEIYRIRHDGTLDRFLMTHFDITNRMNQADDEEEGPLRKVVRDMSSGGEYSELFDYTSVEIQFARYLGEVYSFELIKCSQPLVDNFGVSRSIWSFWTPEGKDAFLEIGNEH